MTDTKYRALIVDDDRTILKLLAMALEDEGFECATATNGAQAMEQIGASTFDLAIVDLAMPVKHGHSVAVELLGRPQRPVIAIVTGLVEPRIAKDLMARGVDDVIAKPVNFTMFAAKMKALVGRRQESLAAAASASAAGADAAGPISISDLNQRLLGMSCILPLSCIAVDVYELTNDREGDTTRVSAALERDPALLAEVLRIANSPRYNPNSDRVVDVEQAVLMIGQKRVGEMALANHALGAVTATVVPWINAPLLSRRSIAAGVGLELLTAGGGQNVQGLLAAAIMHSLGRVVLGSLYPVQYGAVNEHCRRTSCALPDAELHLFPETNPETLARLLRGWNVPKVICEPLSVINYTYDRLASLPETSRLKAELLKVAILIGELAVGQWDPWDVLELPSQSVLQRLAIRDIGLCIDEVRTDLQSIERFRSSPSPTGEKASSAAPSPAVQRRLACRHLCPPAGAMLAAVLRSLGVVPTEEEQDEPWILNAVGAECEVIKKQLASARRPPDLILIDKRKAAAVSSDHASLSLPCSFGHLQMALERIAHERCPASTAAPPVGELAAAQG